MAVAAVGGGLLALAASNRALLTDCRGGPETVMYAIAFGGAASTM
jgi:hypothetical protein